jgi:hypothetical protein
MILLCASHFSGLFLRVEDVLSYGASRYARREIVGSGHHWSNKLLRQARITLVIVSKGLDPCHFKAHHVKWNQVITGCSSDT